MTGSGRRRRSPTTRTTGHHPKSAQACENRGLRRSTSVVDCGAHRLHKFAGVRFVLNEHGLPPHGLAVIDPAHQPFVLAADQSPDTPHPRDPLSRCTHTIAHPSPPSGTAGRCSPRRATPRARSESSLQRKTAGASFAGSLERPSPVSLPCLPWLGRVSYFRGFGGPQGSELLQLDQRRLRSAHLGRDQGQVVSADALNDTSQSMQLLDSRRETISESQETRHQGCESGGLRAACP